MDAVCFDMDGVLVDSEDYWGPYQREGLLPEAGLADLDTDEITGMNYRDIYDYLAAEYGVEVDRDDFLGWYETTAERIYGEDVTLLPGARELVADLRGRGVAVAVVSSSPPGWIDVVRERFDLEVDAVVSADDIEAASKPHPAVYEHAAAELGVDPADATAVEDSVHGVEAARRAGMHVVGFRHGAADDTDRSGAHVAVDSPAALRAYLVDRADAASGR